jgi:hypothetical protein
VEDSMKWSSKNSESLTSEREPIGNDEDDDYEDLSDIPDPLDY